MDDEIYNIMMSFDIDDTFVVTNHHMLEFEGFDPIEIASKFAEMYKVSKTRDSLMTYLKRMILFGLTRGFGAGKTWEDVFKRTSAEGVEALQTAVTALNVKLGNPKDKMTFTPSRLMQAFPLLTFKAHFSLLKFNLKEEKIPYAGGLPRVLRYMGSPSVLTSEAWAIFKSDYKYYNLALQRLWGNERTELETMKFAEIQHNTRCIKSRDRFSFEDIQKMEKDLDTARQNSVIPIRPTEAELKKNSRESEGEDVKIGGLLTEQQLVELNNNPFELWDIRGWPKSLGEPGEGNRWHIKERAVTGKLKEGEGVWEIIPLGERVEDCLNEAEARESWSNEIKLYWELNSECQKLMSECEDENGDFDADKFNLKLAEKKQWLEEERKKRAVVETEEQKKEREEREAKEATSLAENEKFVKEYNEDSEKVKAEVAATVTDEDVEKMKSYLTENANIKHEDIKGWRIRNRGELKRLFAACRAWNELPPSRTNYTTFGYKQTGLPKETQTEKGTPKSKTSQSP